MAKEFSAARKTLSTNIYTAKVCIHIILVSCLVHLKNIPQGNKNIATKCFRFLSEQKDFSVQSSHSCTNKVVPVQKASRFHRKSPMVNEYIYAKGEQDPDFLVRLQGIFINLHFTYLSRVLEISVVYLICCIIITSCGKEHRTHRIQVYWCLWFGTSRFCLY